MPSVIKDLTNLRCGILSPLKCLGTLNGRAVWRCKCDCGEFAVVKSTNLVRASKGQGGTKSCGCLVRQNARVQAEGARAAR